MTFLPFPDLVKSVRVLDNKRLMKQRVEAYQIINILTKKTNKKGWINHPTVKMWKGYTSFLKLYFNELINEVERRGFNNSLNRYKVSKIKIPFWFGYTPLHKSHQASLLRKDYDHYSKYFKYDDKYAPYTYVWISKLTNEQKNNIKRHMAGEIRNPYNISDLSARI